MISGEEIREEALKREKSVPKAMQGSFYYGFREGAKWMQHKYSNKISELTEALDASHVSCEGMKENYIKAIEEAYNKMLHNGTILITKSQFVECFEMYMKGE